jgi:hypothetical protein
MSDECPKIHIVDICVSDMSNYNKRWLPIDDRFWFFCVLH